MIRRMLGFAAELLEVAVSVTGDIIEYWGSGISREDLALSARVHAADAAQLRADLQEANDRLDDMKFSGPTLYKDEVDALQTAMRSSAPFSQSEDTDMWVRQTIENLLMRCDPVPMTSTEMGELIGDTLAPSSPMRVSHAMTTEEFFRRMRDGTFQDIFDELPDGVKAVDIDFVGDEDDDDDRTIH